MRRVNAKVIDDDKGEIIASLNGVTLRTWIYVGSSARITKMLCAREYVEGWCDGWDAYGSAAVPDIRDDLLK